MRIYILTLSCKDKPGIVSAVTTELAAIGANITESNQFWDQQTGQFFMRIAFAVSDDLSKETIERALKSTEDRFAMKTALVNADRKPKIIVMVSKFDHALLHLLYQIRVGWLHADVVGIVSNHED
ncbi:MAG: ACT domain-containing protein, partial [Sneathiella sp.]